MDHTPREAWLSSMAGRSIWTRSMLHWLLVWGQAGVAPQEILWRLQRWFGKPMYVGEVVAEYCMLRSGPKPSQWTPRMEERIKEYLSQGMNVNDITTELFHEFAKPDSGYWQETYRKIQEMRLEGVVE
ncbi:MAG: hypothetical protein Q9186_003001 [Xanthomendoza sp. 1 TL-2023]